MAEQRELHKQIERIEELVGRIETLADPAARLHSRELVQSLMDLHGAGIERMLEMIADTGEPGLSIIDQLAGDKLVASLLLLYGLHPLDLETRITQALADLAPYLQSHGARVELLGVFDGEVKLRLWGGGQGCGSSTKTLKIAVEEALYEAAPDMTGLHLEAAVGEQSPPTLVKLQGRAVSRAETARSEANSPGRSSLSTA